MPDHKVKVLFIAGMTRSGSTILGNVLGQPDDFFCVGELSHIWDRGFGLNRPCSCGLPISDCEIWKKVAERLLKEIPEATIKDMVTFLNQYGRIKQIPLLLFRERQAGFRAAIAAYCQNLDRLYRIVADLTDSAVLVDTSKSPSYGYLLSKIPSIDLYVVHLVRAPYAVAYSWSRKSKHPQEGEAWQQTSFRSGAQWALANRAAELLLRKEARYLRICYDDFAHNPAHTIDRIFGFLGEPLSSPLIVNDRYVDIKPTHIPLGNPNRSESGLTQIKPDTEWETKMRDLDRLLIKVLIHPLYMGRC